VRLVIFVAFFVVFLAMIYVAAKWKNTNNGINIRPTTPEWPQWDLLTDGMAETVYERKLYRLTQIPAGGAGWNIALHQMSKGRWVIVSSEYYDSARIATSEYNRIWQLLPDAIDGEMEKT
jgi:hypothetical protein